MPEFEVFEAKTEENVELPTDEQIDRAKKYVQWYPKFTVGEAATWDSVRNWVGARSNQGDLAAAIAMGEMIEIGELVTSVSARGNLVIEYLPQSLEDDDTKFRWAIQDAVSDVIEEYFPDYCCPDVMTIEEFLEDSAVDDEDDDEGEEAIVIVIRVFPCDCADDECDEDDDDDDD